MNPLSYASMTDAELEATIDAIEPSIIGLPTQHVMIACLAIAISLQLGGGMNKSELRDMLRSTSEYVSLLGAKTTGSIN